MTRAFLLALLCLAVPVAAQMPSDRGSVIFIHPDGAGGGTWAATRALYVGPDEDLHWDLLPFVAVYRGHSLNSLTPSSNAGATMHAYGVKTEKSAFGRTKSGPDGVEPTDAEGKSLSVAKQAIAAGVPTGIVQSGDVVEPGTAVFLADANERKDHEEIVAKLVESGATVMLGGGEAWFLPEGTRGQHGEGKRTDGRNLVEEAREAGYTVVLTREELMSLPAETEKVIGIFASYSTFNDKPEEILSERGWPNFAVEAPTIAEMTEVALRILGRDGRQFLLVVEEEGTDNFANNNNASGTLESAKRADDAIGVARRFLVDHPQTLLVTTADSDAGGMHMSGDPIGDDWQPGGLAPETSVNGSPIDGVSGTGTPLFLAAPDAQGRRLPFYITWATGNDVSGGVLVRADGYNAHLVRGSMQNTDIAKLIRRTLFAGGTPKPSDGHTSADK